MVQQAQPNRAARRHPDAQPQAVPASAPAQSDRLRVFSGGSGQEVQLGDGEIYHVARLTAAGVADIQQLLLSGMPAVDGETVGEQLVGGMLMTQNFAPMRLFLEKAIEEDLPERIEFVSTPDELMYAIDTFFHQSGLRWLENMVKNLTSRAAKAMEEQMASLVDETIRTGKMPKNPWLAGTETPSA